MDAQIVGTHKCCTNFAQIVGTYRMRANEKEQRCYNFENQNFHHDIISFAWISGAEAMQEIVIIIRFMHD